VRRRTYHAESRADAAGSIGTFDSGWFGLEASAERPSRGELHAASGIAHGWCWLVVSRQGWRSVPGATQLERMRGNSGRQGRSAAQCGPAGADGRGHAGWVGHAAARPWAQCRQRALSGRRYLSIWTGSKPCRAMTPVSREKMAGPALEANLAMSQQSHQCGVASRRHPRFWSVSTRSSQGDARLDRSSPRH
jgi:hypothetical protein